MEIDKVYMLVGADAGVIAYQSKPSDKYTDMIEYLDKSLADYPVIFDNAGDANLRFKLYMAGDKYGIGVGTITEKNIAVAYLMDIKNLASFMNLGGILK